MANSPDVRLAVDIGGTFTDLVLPRRRQSPHPQGAHDEPAGGGRARRHAERILGDARSRLRRRRVRPRYDARHQRHHRAARRPSALITTEGFRDVLEIGTESRYDIYDLFLDFPSRWCRAPRWTAPERDAGRSSAAPLDPAAVRAH